MSYTLSIAIALGSSKTGLTLTATILDTAGATVSSTGTGFVEIGSGNYLWTGSLPDSHRGAVKFTGTGVVALVAINTEEAEKINSLQTAATALVQFNGLDNDTNLIISTQSSQQVNFLAPTYGIVQQVDTNVSDVQAILISQTPGAGEYTVDLPVSDGGPIEGAEVWVTATDDPADPILRATTSDSLGNARFYLDTGDYYYWVGRNGYETLGPVAFSVP